MVVDKTAMPVGGTEDPYDLARHTIDNLCQLILLEIEQYRVREERKKPERVRPMPGLFEYCAPTSKEAADSKLVAEEIQRLQEVIIGAQKRGMKLKHDLFERFPAHSNFKAVDISTAPFYNRKGAIEDAFMLSKPALRAQFRLSDTTSSLPLSGD
jgi:hypothetical protein